MDPSSYQYQPLHAPILNFGSIQPTFPTPSELLAELAANGLPSSSTTEELASDSGRSESARKARRRAMAKSIGFIPTDPLVHYTCLRLRLTFVIAIQYPRTRRSAIIWNALNNMLCICTNSSN